VDGLSAVHAASRTSDSPAFVVASFSNALAERVNPRLLRYARTAESSSLRQLDTFVDEEKTHQLVELWKGSSSC